MAFFRTTSAMLNQVLKPLKMMADEANVFFDPNDGMRLKLLCGSVGDVNVVVSFNKEALTEFICLEPTSARIDLEQLSKALDAMLGMSCLFFDTKDLKLHVRSGKLRNTAKGVDDPKNIEDKYTVVPLMEESPENVKVDETKFEYDLIIGFPSPQFPWILDGAEKHHTVTIGIDEKEVLIKQENKTFALREELGEFVRLGRVFNKLVTAKFSLHCLESFALASELAEMVCLFWSEDLPPMLSFPVGLLCTIHVYTRLVPKPEAEVAAVDQPGSKSPDPVPKPEAEGAAVDQPGSKSPDPVTKPEAEGAAVDQPGSKSPDPVTKPEAEGAAVDQPGSKSPDPVPKPEAEGAAVDQPGSKPPDPVPKPEAEGAAVDQPGSKSPDQDAAQPPIGPGALSA